jgi:hypothetical protein
MNLDNKYLHFKHKINKKINKKFIFEKQTNFHSIVVCKNYKSENYTFHWRNSEIFH